MTLRQWFKDKHALSNEMLDDIELLSEVVQLKPGKAIIKRGQIATTVGLLLEGAVYKHFTDKHDKEKVVGFAFEGEPLMALNSFINKTPISTSVVTLENCTIAWTDYERYATFISRHTDYNQIIVSEMTKWLESEKNRMEYLQQPTAKAKYQMMCQLDPQIIERVPLKLVASYLGITQETLSRIRRNK